VKHIQLLGLIIFIFMFSACGTPEVVEEIQETVQPVEIVSPKAGGLSERLRLTGQIQPIERTTLFPQLLTPEAVKSLVVEVGDYVEAGTVLLEIDDQSVKDQIEAARLGYRLARETYESTLEQINLAQEAHERIKVLYESGAATKQELDQAAVQASSEKVDALVAQLNQARQQYDLAKSNLTDTQIVAPTDGVVSKVKVERYGYATQGSVIEISDLSQVVVVIKVPEDYINQISGDTLAYLSIPSADIEKTAEISTINPVADQRSGLFDVEIIIQNDDWGLKPGMTSFVDLILEADSNPMTLPVDCILKDDEGKYVYIVEGIYVLKQSVTTGVDNGERIEILQGITLQDQVLIKGQDFVNDGDEINIVKELK